MLHTSDIRVRTLDNVLQLGQLLILLGRCLFGRRRLLRNGDYAIVLYIGIIVLLRSEGLLQLLEARRCI